MSGNLKLKVCIVVPAYNEAQVIRSVINHAEKVLSKEHSFDHEIVIVNDGSTDNTANEAEATSATIINHILNSGAGSATATGLRYAQKITSTSPSLWTQMANTLQKTSYAVSLP